LGWLAKAMFFSQIRNTLKVIVKLCAGNQSHMR